MFVGFAAAAVLFAAYCGPQRRRLMPSVSCSLSSACLLAGRHEVKENCGGPLVHQSEHWRFSWPCSPLSGVGLVKAMATLQRWLFTASCLAPNANMNWAFLASHSPKASSRCSHPMQFRHGSYKKAAQQLKKNDRIIGPIGPWFPPPLPPGPPSLGFPTSRSPWSSPSLGS